MIIDTLPAEEIPQEKVQQGKLFSVVEITHWELNIPTQASMFVKPDPVQ